MRILIMRFSSIGDIVLTEPVSRLLKEEYPDSTIDFLTKPQFESVAKYFYGVDNIITGEDISDLHKKLKDKSYDIVIDLHGKLRSMILKRLLKSKKVLTYKKHHILRRLLTKGIVNKQMPYTAEQYTKPLAKLNIELSTKDIIPSLNIPVNYTNPYVEELKKMSLEKRKTIAVFPGALHKTKQYPVEQLAEAINTLSVNENYAFYLLGSKAEVELTESLQSLLRVKATNWCGRLSMEELIPVIGRFSLVISNDSGPMHIAAALKVKQVAIFGSTHPVLGFSPLNSNAIVVQREMACRPCTLHGEAKCPKKHFNCMTKLHPEKVVEAFLKLMVDEGEAPLLDLGQ
ncbi:MAG: glycosyltransferase family 9 protein [Candidatus Cloacimonadia bacterium]